MSPEEIQAMAKGLAEGQATWYVLSAVLGGLMTGLGAHLAEKGKNRATKEDIGEITKAVEAAKIEFSRQLEDLKAHHQLRMVAAERRIEAHQTAYRLGSRLYENVFQNDPQVWRKTHQEALDFYERQALFMGKKTRSAFINTLNGANKYRKLRLESGQAFIYDQEDKTPEQKELRRIWEEEMMPLFAHLVTEVELPSIHVSDITSHPSKVG